MDGELLESQEQPIVELLFRDQRTARFDKTTWNITYPELAIFDFMFVSENVHSGETVEIDHRRNLFKRNHWGRRRKVR